jgi:hypothetical protein
MICTHELGGSNMCCAMLTYEGLKCASFVHITQELYNKLLESGTCDINFHCGRMELCVQPSMGVDLNATSTKFSFVVYNFHYVQPLICPHPIHPQNLWAF